MPSLPDPDWYLDHVLVNARPGTSQLTAPSPTEAWRSWWRLRATQLDGEWPGIASSGLVIASSRVTALSRQALRTATRRGRWTQAGRGVVSPIDIRDEDENVLARRRHALMCSAVALRQPAHVISGRSAAILHGLPVFAVPSAPEVTDRAANGLGLNGAKHVHRAKLGPGDIDLWFGIEVTTVARTLVDVARRDPRSAIMAADVALRERLVTRAQIDQALGQAAGWPGVRRARLVLALADPRAESPLESLARLALHDDGIPLPDLQRVIGGDRVDMVFDEQRLVLEIDGLDKYGRTSLREEKRRERRLRRHGYRVERLTWDEVVRDWAKTRVWLRQALGLPA